MPKANLPFKLFLFFSLGVVISYFTKLIFSNLHTLLGILLIWGIAFILFKKLNKLHSHLGFILYPLVLFLGILWNPQHTSAVNTYTSRGKIVSAVKETASGQRFIFRSSSDTQISVFYHSKSPQLYKHDYLDIQGKIKPFLNQQLPHEFNFKNHYAKKDVYFQAFIKQSDLKVKDSSSFYRSYSNLIETIHEKAKQLLASTPLTHENRSLLLGLILGNKTGISEDTITEFKTAGIMHVLAVSGLHVGFIVLFINLLFGRIKFIQPVFFLGLVLVLLWSYALITGFSDSILRATLMFSVLEISACVFPSRKNSLNALFLAAFFTVLMSPSSIFSIGFQLSYTAVLGLLTLLPAINRKLPFKLRRNKLIQLVLASIVAQCSVAPFIFYHFGEFPVYFILGNVLAAPIVPLIFVLGCALLTLSWIPGVGYILAHLTNWICVPFQWSLKIISTLPFSTFTWRWDNSLFMLGLTSLAFLIALSVKKRIWNFYGLGLGVLCLASITLANSYSLEKKVAFRYNPKIKNTEIALYQGLNKQLVVASTKYHVSWGNYKLNPQLSYKGKQLYMPDNTAVNLMLGTDNSPKVGKTTILATNTLKSYDIYRFKRMYGDKFIVPKWDGLHWVELGD